MDWEAVGGLGPEASPRDLYRYMHGYVGGDGNGLVLSESLVPWLKSLAFFASSRYPLHIFFFQPGQTELREHASRQGHVSSGKAAELCRPWLLVLV